MSSGPSREPPERSFEQRLQTARERQGMDTPAAASSRVENGSALGIGIRVGVELVSALAVAALIGYFLDRWLHTKPILLAVFVLLGGAAGIANVYRLMGPKGPQR